MKAVDLEEVTVDGEPLPDDGWGVAIGYEQPPLGDYLPLVVGPVTEVVAGPRLVAWFTKRQVSGEYVRHHEVEPGRRVLGRYQNQTVDFCDGEATVRFRVG